MPRDALRGVLHIHLAHQRVDKRSEAALGQLQRRPSALVERRLQYLLYHLRERRELRQHHVEILPAHSVVARHVGHAAQRVARGVCHGYGRLQLVGDVMRQIAPHHFEALGAEQSVQNIEERSRKQHDDAGRGEQYPPHAAEDHRPRVVDRQTQHERTGLTIEPHRVGKRRRIGAAHDGHGFGPGGREHLDTEAQIDTGRRKLVVNGCGEAVEHAGRKTAAAVGRGCESAVTVDHRVEYVAHAAQQRGALVVVHAPDPPRLDGRQHRHR